MLKLVPTLTWHMEMKERPLIPLPEFPNSFHVVPFNRPDRETYLKIYKAVGAKYSWFDRLLLPVDELDVILEAKTTSVYLLKYENENAGFVEFNLSEESEIEIVYFGITEQFTGKKAGFPFLMWAINHAWDQLVEGRLWLHTCDLDHPAALPLYQKAGFVVYREVTVMQPVLA